MTPALARELRRVLPPSVRRAAERRCRSSAGAPARLDYSRYRLDPVGFCRDVLKVTLTPDQEDALRAILEPPYRVMVRSGHNIGKTFVSACLVVWWYYTRPKCVIITTAPTERDIIDLLWTEIRVLVKRSGLPNHLAPAAPEMCDPDDPEEHRAKGYTARKGESFQGRHRENMLFVFDEAEGVDRPYWTTTNTMFKGEDGHGWFAILNPTTTTSQSYQEERQAGPDGLPKWRQFGISSLDHPNVLAGLENRRRAAGGLPALPLPIPNAVDLGQVEGWLAEWFEPAAAGEQDDELDIEFPPGSGQYLRPSPDGEGRVLGRRPSAGTFGVWSPKLWQMASRKGLGPLDCGDTIPEAGCDVARFGDDKTEIHTRCGPVSLGHETHGGWDVVQVATRLMAVADDLAAWATARRLAGLAPVGGKAIPLKIDDTGVGGGVTDIVRSHGYNAIPVNAGESAPDHDKYPMVRDQLWFDAAARAKSHKLDLSRLPAKLVARLEVQALAPTWKPTADRKRKVESKEELKKKDRLGFSPDGMDSLNLAYYDAGSGEAAKWVGKDKGRPGDDPREGRGRPPTDRRPPWLQRG